MPFELVTDTSCDISVELIRSEGIHVLPLSYFVENVEHEAFITDDSARYEAFLDELRSGRNLSTSLPSPAKTEELFRSLLGQGKDILYVGFTSGLSGTVQMVSMLFSMLQPEYPDRTMIAIDTLCASCGQGLLVERAVALRAAGASIQDAAEAIEAAKTKVAHWFTVDDLMHLEKGGRIPAGLAKIGTLVSIKPLMSVDASGKLCLKMPVKGRAKAIKAVAGGLDKPEGRMAEGTPLRICHSGCLEDARTLQSLVEQKTGSRPTIVFLNPVLATHTGPRTLGFFYFKE